MTAREAPDIPFLLPEEEKLLLLRARTALQTWLSGRETLAPGAGVEKTAGIQQQLGVFVTLWSGGEIRGCIGDVFGEKSLWEGVARSAVLAASEDPRFSPVSREEGEAIRIEISVLGSLQPVSGPAEIEIGRHGLYLRRQRWRGLLLPQVAVEHRWDALAFLEHTAIKAGLPPAAWKGAEIFRFAARIFGDGDRKPSGLG